jgi:hypothetical protein
MIRLISILCLLSACSNSDGLPSTFGDCASPPCEVALEAFTDHPETIPHCERSMSSVDSACDSTVEIKTGTCGDHWAMRTIYGFPGDFYECIYDARDGALVGAKWAPDNHPTQVAGEQLASGCDLSEPLCD